MSFGYGGFGGMGYGGYGGFCQGGYGGQRGGGFALIVVLFILLIIVGAAYTPVKK
ncbi:YjcZ family sporulation protein [Salicibibacter cibarius]|nr:YjcZ family sporulation protein [Salicibibacter cibarius]